MTSANIWTCNIDVNFLVLYIAVRFQVPNSQALLSDGRTERQTDSCRQKVMHMSPPCNVHRHDRWAQ